MENLDNVEVELSIPLQLTRVLLSAGIGFLASEATKKIFDRVVVRKLAENIVADIIVKDKDAKA